MVRLELIDQIERLAAKQAELKRQIAALEAEAGDAKSLYGLLPAEKRLDPTRTTCFVGNLPYEATAEKLTELFEASELRVVRSAAPDCL